MKILSLKTLIILIVIIGVLFSAYAFWGYYSSQVERPSYSLISRDGKIEIREYAPMLVAQVSVSGDREQAINDGFRLLADYIFGNNTLNTQMSMTAPVTQQNIKIAMTAPVTQQAAENNSWQVRFVMPSQYTIQTIPKPKNNQVNLIEVPKHRRVVVSFSGYATRDNLDKYLAELNDYVAKQQLKVIGAPEYAFYNPPWTMGFLRTNEIHYLIDITRDAGAASN